MPKSLILNRFELLFIQIVNFGPFVQCLLQSRVYRVHYIWSIFQYFCPKFITLFTRPLSTAKSLYPGLFWVADYESGFIILNDYKFLKLKWRNSKSCLHWHENKYTEVFGVKYFESQVSKFKSSNLSYRWQHFF